MCFFRVQLLRILSHVHHRIHQKQIRIMSAIGPGLPPHLLAKRKRQQEDKIKSETATASGAKRSTSPSNGEKRRKIIGPAMPPAPLDERPTEPATAAAQPDSDGDDDFGPALPSASTASAKQDEHETADSTAAETPPEPEKLRRDDWMTMPPKQDAVSYTHLTLPTKRIV